MSRENILPGSIGIQPHEYAFDIWMQQTFKRFDLTKLLLYFIDTVSVEALPILAQEFDVLGVKGWAFATTEAQQRQLIKDAIKLHRYKGTPWAVEKAVVQAGIVNGTLVESCGTGPTGWAVFKIVVSIEDTPIDIGIINIAVQLVNVYKNARSHLDGIYFTGMDFADGVTMNDNAFEVDAGDIFGDGIGTTGDFLYDDTVRYDGSRNYNQDTDTITITII